MYPPIDPPPRFALAIIKSPQLWAEIENCAYVSGLVLVNGLDSDRLWALWNLASLVVLDTEGSHHLAEFAFPPRPDLYGLVTDIDEMDDDNSVRSDATAPIAAATPWARRERHGAPAATTATGTDSPRKRGEHLERAEHGDVEPTYRVDVDYRPFDWKRDITRVFSVPDDLGEVADMMGQVAREEEQPVPRAIGVLSAVSGAGATSIAMRIARACARRPGVRGVVVIDPGGGTRLDVSCGVEDLPGARWADVLSALDNSRAGPQVVVSAALSECLPQCPEVDPGVFILSWGKDEQWLSADARSVLAHHRLTPGVVLREAVAHCLREGWWVIMDVGSTWRYSTTASGAGVSPPPTPPRQRQVASLPHVDSSSLRGPSPPASKGGTPSPPGVARPEPGDAAHPPQTLSHRAIPGWEWSMYLAACVLIFPATLRGVYGAHTALEVIGLCSRRRVPTIALTQTSEQPLGAVQMESVLGIAIAGEVAFNPRHSSTSDIHGVLAVNDRSWDQVGLRAAGWAMQARFAPTPEQIAALTSTASEQPPRQYDAAEYVQTPSHPIPTYV